MTLSQRKRAYIGREAMFLGYDGKMYVATVSAVWPRGISIEYPVTLNDGRTRLCTANLTTKDARQRVVVQP